MWVVRLLPIMVQSRPLYQETQANYQVAQRTPPSNVTLIWFYVTMQGREPNEKVNVTSLAINWKHI